MRNLRLLLPIGTALLLAFASCSPKADREVSIHTVVRKNFRNSIRIQGFIEPVNATTVVCPRGIDGLVEWLVEEGTFVEQGDTLCVIDYPIFETFYDQVKTGLEQARTALSQTIATLNMQYALLEAQVRSNEADGEIARMDSLQLLYLSPGQRRIRELQLESANINKARYSKKLEALKVIQASEIRRREIEVEQTAAQVEKVEKELAGLIVKAPKAGLVVLPIAWMTGEKLKLGDNVWTNHPIVNLPEFGEMKVKMFASETDYRQINLNDSISYRFDALPDNVGFGKIINRAYMGQPVAQNSQVKTFEIEGSIDSIGVMPDPGFTAECNIVLKEIENTIVIPQIALFEEDSMKVVFVQLPRGFEMRQVIPGVSSSTETVIEQGLDEGEAIALSRPSEKGVRRRTLLPPMPPTDSTAVQPPAVPVDSLRAEPTPPEEGPLLEITETN